jgi:hypothetical protein
MQCGPCADHSPEHGERMRRGAIDVTVLLVVLHPTLKIWVVRLMRNSALSNGKIPGTVRSSTPLPKAS